MSKFLINPHLNAELAVVVREAAISPLAKDVAAEATRNADEIGAPWMPRRGTGGQTIWIEAIAGGFRVVNTDHGGHLMEWGSINNPPHAIIRRAVERVGLVWKEAA